MIEIKKLNLSYENKNIFSDFNLTVENGEIVGIFGPTGCGKTSLLSYISREYSNAYKISYVYQESRLLSELSVEKNILLPLENVCSKKDAFDIVDKWLKELDLQSLKKEKTKKLSGGEAQRVNIARALAWNGDLFLFDEPFSSQDEYHKNIIKKQIKKLKENGKTILIVSHNSQDLLDLQCRIVEL